jgi:HAD superfamily hydrolase (TIGR01509 family)
VTEAVVFDLDGVIVQSEEVWDEVREAYVRERGGRYDAEVQRALMGMSSTEWSRYMHDQLRVDLPASEISSTVVARLQESYRRTLPLLPGAREAVERLAARWPLGLASSANREIIELVLDLAELRSRFAATVSSEEVARGKPAPDVYLESARRLDLAPTACAAIEDSTNGLRAAAAAEMTVIAVPNRQFPPREDALALAQAVLGSLTELQPDLIEEFARKGASRHME